MEVRFASLVPQSLEKPFISCLLQAHEIERKHPLSLLLPAQGHLCLSVTGRVEDTEDRAFPQLYNYFNNAVLKQVLITGHPPVGHREGRC